MMSATPTGQTAADNGAVAEAVRAMHKAPEQPSLPTFGGPGPADASPGNDVLPLPTTPTSVTTATGSGFVGGNTEAPILEPEAGNSSASVAFAQEFLSAVARHGGQDTAANQSGRLEDLTPRLGTVQAGTLSESHDLADLPRRVGDFFAQLGSLETVPSETTSTLGLAPWFMAAATAVAAWEFARRRGRRPALVGLPTGDTTESLSWVRRPGSSSLSTEEMR
jgi:hypothetical protein